MRLHPNAKTTPYMRGLMVTRVQSGWTAAATAAAASVSVRTVHKWRARHRVGGRNALADRSSCPRHQPRRTSAATTRRIVAARRKGATAWTIATQLRMPRSTVAAVLARAGLNCLARLTPPPPVHRYERAQRGDLVHLDVKRLARIARVGHRIHGQRGRSVAGIGWEYAHVAIDDFSRVAYVEVLADQGGATTAAFLARTRAWFADRGVRIQRVLSDNGGNYRSREFRAVAARTRIGLTRTRPYRPQTNGKAERFIQTLVRGWAYGRPYRNSRQRTAALAAWVRHYNTRRPHTALGFHPPATRFPKCGE